MSYKIPIKLLTLFLLYTAPDFAGEKLTPIQDYRKEKNSLIFITKTGQRIRLTPYGEYIIRIQPVRKGEDFFPDNYYEMIEAKEWNGSLTISDSGDYYLIQTSAPDGILLKIKKDPFQIQFFIKFLSTPVLKEKEGIIWEENETSVSFLYDADENFTGLGHGYLGRSDKINLQGEFIERNYGKVHGEQAPLIVPFYLSGKGYGIFLNTTFPNFFNLGKEDIYQFGFDDKGFESRLDYFFIIGPAFSKILNLYTQLTGRPRFPPKAVFGLGLSDKGHPLGSEDPSDEDWWKDKITAHREAGYPLDHVINDNVWRAGGGERCSSFFEWDKDRYPDPSEYSGWLRKNGLITTIDFNRCIAAGSDGWSRLFNLPDNSGIEFKESAPDLTRKEVREWWWNLFWRKTLNPALGYPGDALWIDEFDEMGRANDSMILGNGRSWAEMKNYWFMLAAKALVHEGWDNSNLNKRPFVWVRGMTAGAQRYATLWSGDILCNYEDMHSQLISMQLAGLSGFPYWGHDAGGFHYKDTGPDENIYRNWAMAFGSFTPYWRPHGTGKSRWPLDRSQEEQRTALVYSRLRYELMPYTYTYAYTAFVTGMPIARAMVLQYQDDPLAWKYDSQYFWGDHILVAPNTGKDSIIDIWLPPGNYFDFRDDQLIPGGKTIKYDAQVGKLPLFIKEGAVIPEADFALSTAFINNDKLNIHIYTGNDGDFILYEDDGETELYRENQKRFTRMSFRDSAGLFIVHNAEGNYNNAPADKTYKIIFHGIKKNFAAEVNGEKLMEYSNPKTAEKKEGYFFSINERVLTIYKNHSVNNKLEVRLIPHE